MRLLWCESQNVLAFYTKFGDLGKITIIDEDYDGENNFVSYPLYMLQRLGYWVDLGEL
jgi:hypothetical protein